MSRFLIIGSSGSGKSTLSRQISQQLDIPFVETDQIYWRSDWTLAPNEEVIGQLLLDRESWVIDNNFVDHRPQVWEAADTIIWLSYSFSTVFRRLAIRNLSWCIFPQKTWTGKRMPVSRSISGIIAKNIWKGHFVIVALLVLGFPAGVYYSMPRLAENFNFEEMLFLKDRIDKLDYVGNSGVSDNTSNFNGQISTQIIVTVTLNRRLIEDGSEYFEIAEIVADTYPTVFERDSLLINAVYGYDIGIARASISESKRLSIQQLEQIKESKSQ